ncbi:DEAD/DEAH box helicase [Glaciibacter psychrotolerans]|uniref:Superfamily II DNA or RNA helicase n=1 Tax=Glaciibacter psychrotolerans TaxID=670054 RepID=A0A7Z0EC02_9MICO|nr:DEAD/DEAH box helicase [Leifsonia psychrotolerans]NYJ18400.1 superfamily II DNA or RNA helicase [Leifsonia psychrotolerans]
MSTDEAAAGAGHGEPAWKRAVDSLTHVATASAGFGYARVAEAATASAALPGNAVPMALQFELREQMPRTLERWSGPSARTVINPESGSPRFRLGVRPVMRGRTGNWVKGALTWTNLSHQGTRLNLARQHHEWFSQFVALHRAVRTLYYGQETDWLYLDEFTSPLLWQLLHEAERLGIPLVGSAKDSVIVVGAEARLSLDATTDAAPDATTDAAPQATPTPYASVAGLRLRTALTIDGSPFSSEFAGAIGDHGIYSYSFAAGTVFTLAPSPAALTPEQRALLGQSATVLVPAHDVPEFMTGFYPTLNRVLTVTSSDSSVHFPETPRPTLVLVASYRPKQTLHLAWEWEYPGSAQPRRPLYASANVSAPAAERTERDSRDPETEQAGLDAVEQTLPAEFAPLKSSIVLQGIDAAEFSAHLLGEIERLPGVRIEIVGERPDYHELDDAPTLKFTTVESEQRDWFDLGVLVTVAGRSVPFGPLFAALAKGRKKLLLVDNSYLSLLRPEFEQLRELIDEAKSLQEWETGLRISHHQAALWADFEDLADETEQALSWRRTVTGLNDLASIEPTPLPAGLRAELRPYQADGFSWLAFLWRNRLGGILADDMGLGKTLQALTLMLHVKQTDARAPFLVVAPTSVVSNWVSEAGKFAPDLVVRSVTATSSARGTALADALEAAPDGTRGPVDVIVTSYTLFRLNFESYQALPWAGLILDEAQFVKNAGSRAHACAVDLDTPFKLAITGTPMENNLLELRALFAVVAPGLFPSARKFTEDYVRQIELGTNPGRLTKLRRRIRPFLLRRTKELVASDLPAKQEQTLEIELNPRHQKLYDTFLQRERQKLLGLLEDLDTNRFIVFRSLTLLRMLSLDASLVDDTYATVPSSKLDALFEQLEDVLAEGHRALVFSQFTSFLKKAAARLDALGTPYCYLDGSTLRRSEVIDRFKSGQAPVFLISLKAGGFGLNLTEADYVFMLDPWWNPASEAQAIDRTHRIGQTKNVMVYRMVAAGTIEEKVMALKAKKAKLFTAVIDDDDVFSPALTADDIRGLLDA